MSIFNIFLILIWAIIVPGILGLFFDTKFSKSESKISLFRSLMFGYIVYFAVFQLMAPFFIQAHAKFSILFYIWCAVILALTVLTLFYSYKKKIFTGFNKFSIKEWIKDRDWLEILIMIAAILVIAFETIELGYKTVIYVDDARFVAEAVESYEKDTLLMYNPVNGEFVGGPIGEMLKDVFAPFPTFMAVFGKLFMLSPTIVTHTVFPFIFIPLCYIAFYFIASEIFRKDRKSIWISIFLFSVLNIFSMETICSFGYTLLTSVWPGRSILYVFILPVIMYELMRMVNTDSISRYDYLILCVTCIAGCLMSGMGALLIPLIVLSYTATKLVVTRKIKPVVWMVVSLLPTFYYFFMYFKTEGYF